MPRRALQELARVVLARRREMRSPLTVVAVTGSQGKTTAKDMLAQVLADGAPTVATAGSFNNELGLPLTVLRCEEQTRYLVLEMGARGVGHLSELCAIAPPDVSLVLNVGKAHIGEFGSQEQIAVAKGELVEALRPDGSAVLNARRPARGGDGRAHRRPGVDVRAVGGRRRAPRRRPGRRPRSTLLRPHLPGRDRARRAAPAGGAPGHQRRRGDRDRARRREAAGPDRRQPARPHPPLEVADAAARAPRRPGGRQRRLQRQPRLDARGARDPRRHGRRAGARSRCWGRCASSAPRAPRSTARWACSPTGSASTSSWSSDPARRACTTRSSRRRAGPVPQGGRLATSRPPRRPASGCARMWPAPTSYSSRRRAPKVSSASPRCSSMTTSGHEAGEESVS